jgi:hypothetical protein
MRLLTTHSESDTIAAYLDGKSGIVLSPKLQHKLKRMETAADLYRHYGSKQKVATMLMRLDVYTAMGAASRLP